MIQVVRPLHPLTESFDDDISEPLGSLLGINRLLFSITVKGRALVEARLFWILGPKGELAHELVGRSVSEAPCVTGWDVQKLLRRFQADNESLALAIENPGAYSALFQVRSADSAECAITVRGT